MSRYAVIFKVSLMYGTLNYYNFTFMSIYQHLVMDASKEELKLLTPTSINT